ncbi:hypothetical protein NQ176_g10684 [Zarea fungicola]|uniref:Uncharacterized protein n=1 Tax=Zarea fungicola TaxID=93591 RepID=A0ACC1MF78_9HYPO|nr:hypothetical protein NQ176_g10684 [Lecanicillium fungicola]
MSDATTTGVATSPGASTRSRTAAATAATNGTDKQQQSLHEQQKKQEQELPTRPPKSRSARPPPKYRHVEATHSLVRPSCLSHDSNASPSFLGFRNLMVIVLGRWIGRVAPWCYAVFDVARRDLHA